MLDGFLSLKVEPLQLTTNTCCQKNEEMPCSLCSLPGSKRECKLQKDSFKSSNNNFQRDLSTILRKNSQDLPKSEKVKLEPH